ncbi:hypothetical protein THAOC_08133, partial [Thalassiosira oceanica]
SPAEHTDVYPERRRDRAGDDVERDPLVRLEHVESLFVIFPVWVGIFRRRAGRRRRGDGIGEAGPRLAWLAKRAGALLGNAREITPGTYGPQVIPVLQLGEEDDDRVARRRRAEGVGVRLRQHRSASRSGGSPRVVASRRPFSPRPRRCGTLGGIQRLACGVVRTAARCPATPAAIIDAVAVPRPPRQSTAPRQRHDTLATTNPESRYDDHVVNAHNMS